MRSSTADKRVEGRQLVFGGGRGHDETFEWFVARAGRGRASEDRDTLAAFLESDGL